MKTALICATLPSALLLTGCDGGTRPAAPAAPAPSSTSTEDTTGTFRPMIGVNGKLGVGIDLGNGLTLSPSGSLGIGF